MFKMDSSLRENASKRLLKSLKMIMPTTLAGRFLPVCGGHFLRTGPAGSAGGHPTFRAPHPQPCSLRPGSLSWSQLIQPWKDTVPSEQSHLPLRL